MIRFVVLRISSVKRTGVTSVLGVVVMLAAALWSGQVLAQTLIYVENNTSDTLVVTDVRTEGDNLSKKAWKKGAVTVPPGGRVSVMSINRTGKINWMDPTPRFVEPGSTVVFVTEISFEKSTEQLLLKQKLYGQGKTTKMWYSLGGLEESFDWTADHTKLQGEWLLSEGNPVDVTFRSFEDGVKTHVEYVITAR